MKGTPQSMTARLPGPLSVKLAGLLVLLAVSACSVQETASPSDTDLTWPNAESRANSDDWIARNHDRIRQMRPKVLVLNFVNGLDGPAARARVARLINALRESSRD